MFITHVSPLSCLTKNSRIYLTLTAASKLTGFEPSWLRNVGNTAKEVVQNTHHWSQRTETTTENKAGQDGSRRQCSSHLSVTSSVNPDQWCVFCTHLLSIFRTCYNHRQSQQEAPRDRYCRDSTPWRPLRHSRSFKVTAVTTNRNPLCDLLLVLTYILFRTVS